MEKISTIILSIVIIIFSLIGAFTNEPMIDNNIPYIMLFISSTILYICVTTKSNIESQNSTLITSLIEVLNGNNESLVSSLKGVEFEMFKSPDKQVQYMTKRVKEAQNSVKDLTWQSRVSTEYDAPKRQKRESEYVESIQKVAKEISYTEIFSFNHDSRKKKLKAHYEYIDRNSSASTGYSCAYFEDSTFPRFQFLIVDDEEIIFTGNESIKCRLKHPEILKMFNAYFASAWEKSIHLIENGRIVNEVEIKKNIIC